MENKETVPSYGLLQITAAYNDGKLSLNEWLELAEAWAKRIIEQSEAVKAA